MKKTRYNNLFLKIISIGLTAVLCFTLAAVPAETAAASSAELDEPETASYKNTPSPSDAESESGSIADTDIAMSDEIIVVYDDAGVSDAKSEKIQENAEEALNDIDAEVTEEVMESNDQQGTVVVAEIPEDIKIEEAIEQIESDKNVSFAQPNFVYSMIGDAEPKEVLPEDMEAADTGLETENVTYDDLYNQLINDAEIPKYSNYLRDTKVYDAWDIAQTNGRVTVAVLDSGCRLNHEDLQNNILLNYAYDSYYNRPLTTSSSPNGGDSTGHGTHVCGLISAEADNRVGIAGTSYNAKILPVKIFDNYGGGATTATFMKGIEYCRQLIESGKVKNLKVMNMSVGYYSDGTKGSVDILLENMINIMADYYDVLCVCSGGNGDDVKTPYVEPMYPSDFDNCLSVTSLDMEGFNSLWSDYNQSKDISAPGEKIISTYCRSRNDYVSLDGTSMAAPIVAGICALLWAKYPSLSTDEVVRAVEVTADSGAIQYRDDDTDLARKANTGSHGVINAEKALNYVSNRIDEEGSASIETAEVSGISSSYEYTGGKIRPAPVIMMSGVRLKKNSDYVVSYSNNIDTGTATVTIEGIGNYNGIIVKTFDITVKNIAKCSIVLSQTSYAYTGKAMSPAVTVSVSSRNAVKLKNGVDYTISYSRNTEPGTASVTIRAKGSNYTGSVVKNYTITKADISKLPVSISSTAYTYNKKAKKPSVKIQNGSLTLALGKDFSVSYSKNVKVGTGTVKITGKGSHYTGTVKKTFKINPKGTSISKLTKKSKGFKVKWKKQSTQTTGYQVQYSVSKKFTKAKTKTIKSTKTTSAAISKLKKKKVYYVRVRTYKKIGSKKYYSGWSKIKKVKTK